MCTLRVSPYWMQGLGPSMHLPPFPPETDLAHCGEEPGSKVTQMQSKDSDTKVNNNVTVQTNHKNISCPADPSSSVVLDEVQHKREIVQIHIAMPG